MKYCREYLATIDSFSIIKDGIVSIGRYRRRTKLGTLLTFKNQKIIVKIRKMEIFFDEELGKILNF